MPDYGNIVSDCVIVAAETGVTHHSEYESVLQIKNTYLPVILIQKQ
jgi:hypothetical protein